MNETLIHQLCAMTGVNYNLCKIALEVTNYNITKAIALIRSNPDIIN